MFGSGLMSSGKGDMSLLPDSRGIAVVLAGKDFSIVNLLPDQPGKPLESDLGTESQGTQLISSGHLSNQVVRGADGHLQVRMEYTVYWGKENRTDHVARTISVCDDRPSPLLVGAKVPPGIPHVNVYRDLEAYVYLFTSP